jgi:3-deoxy-D-manno-octulosonic-acid transferase
MFSAAARFLYSGATAFLAVCLAPLFLLSKRGRIRLSERFGNWKLAPDTYVWFHGASLGEINGLLPVIREFREKSPAAKILLSATSATGVERGSKEVEAAHLLPFDCPLFLERAIGKSRISMLVITETELWPGLIHVAKRHGAKLCLVNGIISDYSYGWYRTFRPLISLILGKFAAILCGSAVSRERFIELGAFAEGTIVTGNSKYDLPPSVSSRDEAQLLKRKLFSTDRPVLVLGSLRPGEEETWFPELAASFRNGAGLNVIVAPRHKEKFGFFAQRLNEFGIPFVSRSLMNGASEEQVILLDTYGELEATYSFADVAFVGGTLVDWGGHNPLEPACYGACIAIGPYARKVQAIVSDLQLAQGVIVLKERGDIATLLGTIQTNLKSLREMGERAQGVWRSHRGATAKVVACLQKVAA